MKVLEDHLPTILSALRDSLPVSGFTHRYYNYPARFSPLFVRSIIETFTKPGDTIVDPFMGGGTTIIESIASGRRAIGTDINPLSSFITKVKTTPLSKKQLESTTLKHSSKNFSKVLVLRFGIIVCLVG
jgi:hypothetical protein